MKSAVVAFFSVTPKARAVYYEREIRSQIKNLGYYKLSVVLQIRIYIRLHSILKLHYYDNPHKSTKSKFFLLKILKLCF